MREAFEDMSTGWDPTRILVHNHVRCCTLVCLLSLRKHLGEEQPFVS